MQRTLPCNCSCIINCCGHRSGSPKKWNWITRVYMIFFCLEKRCEHLHIFLPGKTVYMMHKCEKCVKKVWNWVQQIYIFFPHHSKRGVNFVWKVCGEIKKNLQVDKSMCEKNVKVHAFFTFFSLFCEIIYTLLSQNGHFSVDDFLGEIAVPFEIL